jgi:hypothetical protein
VNFELRRGQISESPSPMFLIQGMSELPNPLHLRPLDIRRAILGTFMRADGGPLTIDQVVRLLAAEGLDLATTQRTSARQRISDVMRHQVRIGRASAPARGLFGWT